MLHLIPAQVPELAELVRDLGNPTPATLGRALGVSERTVWRWLASGAPLAARLALHWLTPWGWSAHESEARRRLSDWRGLSEALQRENEALRAEIGRLQAIGDYGAANDPSRHAPMPAGAAWLQPGPLGTVGDGRPAQGCRRAGSAWP